MTSGKIKFQPEPRRWFSHCYKPIVSAVNGFATGGGMELVMLTDIRIAAQHARFGLPEVRWGITPMIGGACSLVQQIPHCRAMELLLAGDLISAREALQYGLINRVVPGDDLMSEAIGTARRLCENGPIALRLAKEVTFRLANKGIPGSAVTLGWFGMGMETALHNIYNLMESCGVFPVASGSAISSTAWKGLKADYSPNGVLDDRRGVFLVQEQCGRRLAKIAKMMKYARDGGLSAAYAVARRDKKLM